MPFVTGFLRVRHGGHPDNELPEGEGPVDPGYGIDAGGRPDQGLPPYIDNTLPTPPPGVWPPPSIERPIVPVHPDNTLPVQPGTIWPSPGRPNRPDNSLPGGSGGEINNGLPSQTFWMVAYCPSLGWKYISVDPSLVVGGGPAPIPEPKE